MERSNVSAAKQPAIRELMTYMLTPPQLQHVLQPSGLVLGRHAICCGQQRGQVRQALLALATLLMQLVYARVWPCLMATDR